MLLVLQVSCTIPTTRLRVA